MKAYVIVQETIKDEEMFAAYRNGVVATLEEFGCESALKRDPTRIFRLLL